jgi:hypothetical protein
VTRVREWLPDGWSRSHSVTLAAMGLVGAATGLRGWAVAGGWFYNDDLEFLAEAHSTPLTWDFVSTPHDDKLMPAAHVLSWLVARNGAYSWATAATITIAAVLVAGLACWWMLRRLFGDRWAILVPLTVYVVSPLTLPATMWWAAALNQLPLQIAMFTSVTSFVTYQRTGRLRHVSAVCLSIAVGLAFYEKTLLIAGLLAGLALAYFAGSGRWPSVSTFLRSSGFPLGAVAVLCLGYLALRSQVARAPLQTDAAVDVEGLVDTMVLESFGTAVLGGPWTWTAETLLEPSVSNLPNAAADPAPALVLIAWVVIAAVVAFSVLRRRRAARAWALVGLSLVTSVGLTAAGRSYAYGPDIGYQLRYLTDTLPVVVLCASLAFLDLPGAPGSSRPREQPLLLWQPPRLTLAVLAAVLVIGSVTSTVRYASYWHSDFPVRAYVANVRAAVEISGRLELTDTPVPPEVLAPELAPHNLPSRLLSPLGEDILTPEAGTDLQTLAASGLPVAATALPGAVSAPGQIEKCGWLVDSDGDAVPLTGTVYDGHWWVTVNYLGSAGGTLDVTAGDNQLTVPIERGPHTLFFQTTDSYDRIFFSDVPANLVLCVYRVVVGPIGELTF